jgi:telomerase protein component 1
MSANWRTVSIFISSTFRDMRVERDLLIRLAFPELRERCEKRRLHLVEIDLRWGIPEEQTERGTALQVCLDEIDRCRPYFVGLLGERYGWVPDRYQVPDELAYRWLRTLSPGKSITALEIYHAVLRKPESLKRAFFYFRDAQYVNEIPAAERDDYCAEAS